MILILILILIPGVAVLLQTTWILAATAATSGAAGRQSAPGPAPEAPTDMAS